MWETYVEITSIPLNGEFLLEDSQRWWMISFSFLAIPKSLIGSEVEVFNEDVCVYVDVWESFDTN